MTLGSENGKFNDPTPSHKTRQGRGTLGSCNGLKGGQPHRDRKGNPLKVATFNINNINQRLDNLLAWLAKAEPDVVSLQELKAEQDAFPVKALRALGYEAVWQGERSWNGVAILARNHVPVLTRTSLPGNSDGIFARGSRDPFDKLRASSERSRSSGGAKDFARS